MHSDRDNKIALVIKRDRRNEQMVAFSQLSVPARARHYQSGSIDQVDQTDKLDVESAERTGGPAASEEQFEIINGRQFVSMNEQFV